MGEVKELLVISGKGGTGKTSIVGAFAVLAKSKVLADCDVDAADLYLLLRPDIRITREFYGSKKATIDQTRCIGCGRCAEVRRQARSIAESQGLNYIITDGPPGIGCPVISSISGVDLALVVTEPTVAGRHDMKRILDLARHFDIETMVCINKYDLDKGKTRDIEDYCHEKGVEVAGRIPFDEEVVHALVRGLPLVEYECDKPNNGEGKASKAIRELWKNVSSHLE